MNEIWESERQALEAIYDVDFKAIVGAWNSISCSLRLEPRGEKGEAVLLSWKVPPGYPKTIPSFSVTQSNINLTDLEEKVQKLALGLKGTEMIYDIANFIQDELVPATQSFYESMVNRVEQEKIEKVNAQKELEDLKFEKVALLEEKVNQDIQAKKSLLQVAPKSQLKGSLKIQFSTGTLQPSGNASSRYGSDFEEIEFLGKGGYNALELINRFGSVVKVKNRVDGQVPFCV